MGLLQHAKREMKLVGLDKPDSDYGGKIYHAVIELIDTFAKQGHSGFSAGQVRRIFNQLTAYKTLSPITDNPSEWAEVDGGLWQNARDSSCFSKDGGKTHYCVDDKERKIVPTEHYKP